MHLFARDIMSRDIVTVSEETSLKEALDIMKEQNVSSLLVSCRADRPFGIVTRHDMIRALVVKKIPEDWPVSDIMTAPILFATPNLRAEDAAVMMARYRIRRLPVFRKGEIVGIISNTDIFNSLPYPSSL